jgi:ribonucleoside-diphosphate reductase alpha chain
MSLQYGVPLDVYVTKFSHTRFEPMGHTKNPDIRIAKSIVDYIFRWLGITFVPGFRESNGMQITAKEFPDCGSDDAEAERGPAATKAGGPNAGHGSAAASKASVATAFGNGSTAGSSDRSSNGNGHSAGARRPSAAVQSPMATLERVGLATPLDPAASFTHPNEQFASFQTDAPSCDACGAITVRNGNCYLCHNCGNSMGCS